MAGLHSKNFSLEIYNRQRGKPFSLDLQKKKKIPMLVLYNFLVVYLLDFLVLAVHCYFLKSGIFSAVSTSLINVSINAALFSQSGIFLWFSAHLK